MDRPTRMQVRACLNSPVVREGGRRSSRSRRGAGAASLTLMPLPIACHDQPCSQHLLCTGGRAVRPRREPESAGAQAVRSQGSQFNQANQGNQDEQGYEGIRQAMKGTVGRLQLQQGGCLASNEWCPHAMVESAVLYRSLRPSHEEHGHRLRRLSASGSWRHRGRG